MIRPDDLEHCRNVIRTGSLSFHAASKLLPASVRDPALALYAFCRLADDEVDEGQNKARAVIELQERLALVYAGKPPQCARGSGLCLSGRKLRHASRPARSLVRRDWPGMQWSTAMPACRTCAAIAPAWPLPWVQ